MTRRLVLAASLVLLAAPAALAGTITQLEITDAFTGNAPQSPDYFVTAAVNEANGNAFDGNLVFDLTSQTAGGYVEAIVHFESAQTLLQIAIGTRSVLGVYLAAVSFEQAGGGTPAALWIAGFPADGALPPNAQTLFTFDLTGGTPWSLSPEGGFAAGSTYTRVALLFAFDEADQRLALDSLSNVQLVPLPPAAWSGIAAVVMFGLLRIARRLRARDAIAG